MNTINDEIIDNTEVTQSNNSNEDSSLKKLLIPKGRPLFVFRFTSGKLNKTNYAITAKTLEEAKEKLRLALGDDDSNLNFESMTEWKVESASGKKIE